MPVAPVSARIQESKPCEVRNDGGTAYVWVTPQLPFIVLMRSVTCFLPASQRGVIPGVRFTIHGSRPKKTFPTLQASRHAALNCDNVAPSKRKERNTNSSRHATISQSQSVHRATPAADPTDRNDAEASKPLQLLEEALAAHHGRLDARTVAALMKQVRQKQRNPNLMHT